MIRNTIKLLSFLGLFFLSNPLLAYTVKEVSMGGVLVPAYTHANSIATLTFNLNKSVTSVTIWAFTSANCVGGTHTVTAACGGTCSYTNGQSVGISGGAALVNAGEDTINSALVRTVVASPSGSSLLPSFIDSAACIHLNGCTKADKDNCTTSNSVSYTYG